MGETNIFLNSGLLRIVGWLSTDVLGQLTPRNNPAD
jgi:hypothetical protein